MKRAGIVASIAGVSRSRPGRRAARARVPRSRAARARGYALVLVLVVLILMGVAVGSLSYLLGASVAESRRVIATVRIDDACASALDVTARVLQARLRALPSSDPDELVDALCALGTCDTVAGVRLPRMIAPPGTTLTHLAIVYDSPLHRTARPIPAGRFAGRVATEQSLVVNIMVTDNLTQRTCNVSDRYVVPGLPLTAFPVFGTAPTTRWSPPLSVRRSLDGAPSRIHVNGNAGGLTGSDIALPGPQHPGELPPIDLAGSTVGSDQLLAPAVAQPSMGADQAALPRSFRWLVDPPAASDTEALRATRLSARADVVIIDGVWYNNRDKSLQWPGVPIWSDRPGNGVTHVEPANAIVDAAAPVGLGDLGFLSGQVPSLFSWYDREAGNQPLRPQPTGGVLSYGPLAIVPGATNSACSLDSDCTGADLCLKRNNGAAKKCHRLEPGVWRAPGVCSGGTEPFRGLSECPSDVRAIVDGARSGFGDKGRDVLPINIDLKTLADALSSPTPGELGDVLGIPSGGPQRFNGVIYITSRFNGGSLPTPDLSALDLLGLAPVVGKAQAAAPIGLCGGGVELAAGLAQQPCIGAARPNAVRVYNGGFLPAGIFVNGLTIATDLPLYVYGDLNRVRTTTVAGVTTTEPQIKVALVGDRITFLSREWRDEERPWDASIGATSTSAVMVVEASLITGVPLRPGNVHNLGDAFRALETFEDDHFILRGHIIMGWNSRYLDSTGDDVDRGLRWLPDYHLDNPGFQPPGMPVLNLPPSGRWRRR